MNPEAILKILKMKMADKQKLAIIKTLCETVPARPTPGSTVQAPVATAPGVTVPPLPPAPPMDHGKQLVPADTLIICSACGKSPHKTVAPLYQHMKSEELCAAFDPPLTAETQLWADPYGNVAIDCRLCQLTKTVWILGKGNFESTGDNSGYSVTDGGTPYRTGK